MTDKPTPERLAKSGDDFEEVITAIIDRNGDVDQKMTLRLLDGSVLDMLLSRGTITTDQFTAGGQFYSDWYYSGFANSGVVDPTKEHVDGGNSDQMQDRALDAAGRFFKACIQLSEPRLNVLNNVMLLETKLEDYGFKRYGRKDPKDARLASITSLQDALTALDHHYYGKCEGKTRAAHELDYRPTIRKWVSLKMDKVDEINDRGSLANLNVYDGLAVKWSL